MPDPHQHRGPRAGRCWHFEKDQWTEWPILSCSECGQYCHGRPMIHQSRRSDGAGPRGAICPMGADWGRWQAGNDEQQAAQIRAQFDAAAAPRPAAPTGTVRPPLPSRVPRPAITPSPAARESDQPGRAMISMRKARASEVRSVPTPPVGDLPLGLRPSWADIAARIAGALHQVARQASIEDDDEIPAPPSRRAAPVIQAPRHAPMAEQLADRPPAIARPQPAATAVRKRVPPRPATARPRRRTGAYHLTCSVCSVPFTSLRRDAEMCSTRCRMRRYRGQAATADKPLTK